MITNKLKAMLALAFTAALCACTDIDLCPEDSHPHRAQVRFVHEWGEYDDDRDRPDSMYVIANRVINYWKMTAAIYTKKGEPNEGKGRYVYNQLSPSQPPQGEEESPSQPPQGGGDTLEGSESSGSSEDSESSENSENSETHKAPPLRGGRERLSPSLRGGQEGLSVYDKEVFDLQVGEYKFYTFTATNQMDMRSIDKFISTDDNNMTNEGFTIEYNTYEKTDEVFMREMDRIMEPLTAKGFSGWVDFNPYSKYMLPASRPLFIDSVNITPVTQGRTEVITFSPKPATQTITINVKIRKKATEGCTFKVEGVIGEVSGVPHAINISNGFIDIATTNKMMFPFSFAGIEEDTEDNDFLTCTARINVPSIVKSNTDEATVGPGLLQAFIYCTVYREGHEPQQKKIQGIINMYDELTAANLIEITEDGNHARRIGREHTIDIGPEIVIDGSMAIPSDDEGIKGWIQTGKDIDVEL